MPEIVLTVHGGNFNFLTIDWHCKFTRETDFDEWKWVSSSAFRNLEAAIYTFESLDEEPKMKELDWDTTYAAAFGKHYRHLASDTPLVYEQPDGTLVNQKDEHWEFIESKAEEVSTFARQDDGAVLKALLSWEGAGNFLKTCNGWF